MKVLALVLSTVIATVIIAAGSVVVIVAVPHPPDALVFATPIVLSAMVYGAVLFGSLLTYFDPRRSKPSMAAFRRWAIGIGIVNVAALATMFVVAAVTATPLWVPLLFTATAVVLFGVAVAVGNALRRYDEHRDHRLPSWSPVSREQIMRKVVKVIVTFVVAFVLVFGLELILATVIGRSAHLGVGTDLVFGFVFAFFASGFACVLVTLPLNRQLRGSLNRDLGRTRKLARLVLRGKNEDLSADERVPAARYASILAITLPFTLAYIVLLYAGLAIQTAEQLSNDQSIRGFSDYFLVLLVVVLVVVVPLQVVRILRARRYVREHHDLLDAESTTASQTAG